MTKPDEDKEFAALIAAAEACFANAKMLYDEAIILAKADRTARALFLHQISLEELGKFELLGAWITGRLAGTNKDANKFYKKLAQHRAKNFANSYFLDVEGEELAAQDRKDAQAKLEAFAKVQQKFHTESNDAKNSALYVDVGEGKMQSPVTTITKEMLAAIKSRNEQFLTITHPKLAMLHSWLEKKKDMGDIVKEFLKVMEEKRKALPADVSDAAEIALKELARIMSDKNAQPEAQDRG